MRATWALAWCLFIEAVCETAWSTTSIHPMLAVGDHHALHLSLRGGTSDCVGYTGLPDEELLDEARAAHELWCVAIRVGYVRAWRTRINHDYSSTCEEARMNFLGSTRVHEDN